MYTTPKIMMPFQVQPADTDPHFEQVRAALVHLRPMRPEDVMLILDMHERLSPDSVYFRYFHPYRPTLGELDAISRMKPSQGAAFVAATEGAPEEVIAHAFYRIDPQDCTIAQPALLVEDRFQNQGLGQDMMNLLMRDARTRGVRVMNALVHPANGRMMHLIERSGLPFKATLSYAACEVRVEL